MTAPDQNPPNPWAFPVPYEANVNGTEGMTLRDFFAAHALAGMLANSGEGVFEDDASAAFGLADAMLAARAKTGGADE